MNRAVTLLLVTAVAAVFPVSVGCGDGGGSDAIPVLNTGRADINATDAGDVALGGELRWPYARIPLTFNHHQTNGRADENDAVINALLPRLFLSSPDGRLRPDPSYLASAELVSKVPQTVRYVLNPKATWSDGTPITWRDFEAMWKALNGTDPAYQSVSKNGYDEIIAVAPGVDDKQALITFQDSFAEWQGLFSPLYPASSFSNPVAFNTAWVRKIPVSAGPFLLQALDPVNGRITLARNEAWWGPRAKLDRIVFKPYNPDRHYDGLATNDLDFAPIGYNVDLARRARTLPNFVIRQAVNRDYQQLVFNGGPGTLLADLELRQAVVRGLDRTAIARRAVGEITPAIRADGNHIHPVGSAEYRDNSDQLPFDVARANQELDALGWRRQGSRRTKDGRPLALRLVTEAGNPVSEQVGATVAEQLGDLGINAVPQPLAAVPKDLALRQGGFDLFVDEARRPPMPLSTEVRRYYQPIGVDVGQNYGRVFNDDVVELFGDAANELDELQRTANATSVDKLIWTVVHNVPLFPSPGVYAVRDTLANFGAPGLADIDYTQVGFVS